MGTIAIIAAIQIVFCIIIVSWVRASIKGHLSDDKVLERVRRELNSLMIEMEGSADRNISILEDRIQLLKDLVAEADKRIGLLAQESGKRAMESAVYSQLGQNRPIAAAKRPEPVDSYPIPAQPEPQQYYNVPEPAPVQQAQQQQPQAPIRPREQIPFVRLATKQVDLELPFVDKVLDFYHRGFSTDIIAAKTGATMAEVDLVISMEQNRRLGRPAE